MNYKAIFSDIDGTLLDSNNRISEAAIDTIQKINNFGIPFILVSARMPAGIIPIQKQLKINSPIICFSGALILGGEKGDRQRDTIQNVCIDVSDIEKIYQITISDFKDISISLYQNNNWFAESNLDPWVKNEGEITDSSPLIRDFPSLFSSEELQINKILCMGPPEHIDQLNSRLKKIFPELTINKSKPAYLEIMGHSVLKSSAIKVIERKLGLEQKEIIAVGDNYNDMDMLKYAGMGIAMGNSPEEVKAIANDITGTNDEDGLRQALQKYFFTCPLQSNHS